MEVPLDEDVMREWLSSSLVLYCTVLLVTVVTLPLLAICMISLREHRKNQYYVCLMSIIAGNMVLLASICAPVIIDRFPVLQAVLRGSTICQANLFLVNASSCFVHWTWVVMYMQRCFCVFFPMRARKNGGLPKGGQAVAGVLVFSLISQLWTPLLMTEVTVESNGSKGAFCSADSLKNSSIIQLTAVVECVVTFFIPLTLTVFTDISVLVLRNPCQPTFLLVPAETVGGDVAPPTSTYIKIVSQKNIACSQRRRHAAIRRCLVMATITLFLNLPNYSLQVMDEFMQLRYHHHRAFIKADAAAYILYLLQFPLVPVYVYFLRGDFKPGSARIVVKRPDTSTCRSHASLL